MTKNEYGRMWHAKHREKRNKKNREYYTTHKEQWVKWKREHPESIKNAQKRYYANHKEQILERDRLYHISHKNEIHKRLRKYRYSKEYNITLEQYNNMLLAQNGVCAICGQKGERMLCVDHDHTTGKVRGLLCDLCNRGLGFFKENTNIIIKALVYLNKIENK